MIRDFWGCEVAGAPTPSVKAFLAVPGRDRIGLRPLSLERLMRLLELAPVVIPTPEQLAGQTPEQIVAEFGDLLRPAAWVALGVDCADVPTEALIEALGWYGKEHNWKRISDDLLKADGGGAGGTAFVLEDLCYTVEVACGRTIEAQLAMRPEAWLSLLETMERRAQREREQVDTAAASQATGPNDVVVRADGIGVEDLFGLMPGGEIVEFPATPPAGGEGCDG